MRALVLGGGAVLSGLGTPAAAVTDADLLPAPAPTEATPVEGPEITPPPRSLAGAEPISPATLLRFPHLADFQGHVLLTGATLQVVLAGVPPRPLVGVWQPALLATFEKIGADWQPKRSLAAIDFRNTSGLDFQPLAVDLGVDPEQGAAYASYIYAAEGQKNVRQLVTYRLDGEGARLAVVFDDYAEGDPLTKASHRWHLRLRNEQAASLDGPIVDWGGLRGRTRWLGFVGADLTGLIAYRAFATRYVEGGRELIPQLPAVAPGTPPTAAAAPKDRQPLEGFELLLTRKSTAGFLRRHDDVGECLFGTLRPKTLPRPEARLPWVQGCATDARRTLLGLTAASKDAGQAATPQPVYVFDPSGIAIQYTALFQGETLDLDVPHSVALELADTAEGRLVDGGESLRLERGERREVTLTARAAGTLRLDLGKDRRAALLTVRRLDTAAGEPGVVHLETAGAAAVRLNQNVWLVKAWPILLDVVSGGYEVQLARGRQGVFCSRRVWVGPETPTVVRCEAGGPAAAASDELGAVYADLSFSDGPQDPLSYGAALGVDWLARPLGEAAPRAAGRNPKAERLLPVLRVSDEASGVALQLIPATPALAQRWAKRKPGLPQDLLPAFARFARDEARGALLELGCPSPGLSLFEYELMAQRLAPDALRLFGCRDDDAEPELLALWTRLSLARNAPMVLTAASQLERPGTLRFPRLALAKAAAGQDPTRHLLTALAAGRASVSAGARVEVVALKLEDRKGRGPRDGEAVVRVHSTQSPHAPSADVASTLTLYSERGQLKQEAFGANIPAPVTDVKLTFSLPDGAQWLRFEVRAPSVGGAPGRILATTGLMVAADLAADTLKAAEAATKKEPVQP